MADDHPDILRPGTGHRQQVVDDRQGIDAVDIQDPVEHQVHRLADLPRVAVLDGQDRVVALALDDGQIGLIKGRKGDAVSLREDLFRRDMGEGPRRPRKGHPGPADQALLILPGNTHHFLHEHRIILPDLRVCHKGRVPVQDLLFLLLIEDREAPLPLVVGHIPDDLHPLLKEGRHLLIDLTNFLSCLFQISHHTHLTKNKTARIYDPHGLECNLTAPSCRMAGARSYCSRFVCITKHSFTPSVKK